MKEIVKNNTIVRGISVDYFGTFFVILAGFLAIPYYLVFISKEQYGLWLAINSVVLLIALVDLATDQFLTTVTANDKKFCSEEYAGYLTSILLVKTMSAAVVLLISCVVLTLITSILNIDENLREEAQNTFSLAVLVLVCGIFSNAIPSILYARHHYSLVNASINFFLILSVVSTVIFLWMGYGIISFPMGQLIGTILQGISLTVFLKQRFPHVRLKIKSFKFLGKSELLVYATNFQALRWLYTFRAQYISIAINNLVGATSLAQYMLTSRLAQLGPTLSAKFANAFLPSIVNIIETGGKDKVASIFKGLSKVLMRMAIFTGIVLLTLNESFVAIWVGVDDYAGDNVLIFIVIYMVLFMAMAQFAIVIFASKRFEKWNYWSFFEIISAVVLSYLFSLHFGLMGVLMGFFISSLPTQAYLFRIVLRQLDLCAWEFVKEIFIYSLKPNIIPVVVAFAVIIFQIEAKTWGGLFGLASLFLMVHLLFEIILTFRSRENGLRNKIIHTLKISFPLGTNNSGVEKN